MIFSEIPPQTLTYVGIAAGVILALVVLRVLLGRRRTTAVREEPPLRIDVAQLTVPDVGSAVLEFYNMPVRLAAVVLAPSGRSAKLPPADEMPATIEQLVPGLMAVLKSDQPVFRRWPGQLSSSGFSSSFFTNVPLPGDFGKGTPWCAAAGRFEAAGQNYLIGLVMKAAGPNSLSQVAIERSAQWLDVLRIRRPA
ncbi:MAG: hypothetical protein IID44_29185 [Planctomycetes bacterium]|nr:hypothetical protein [Planctomycetota bacterium]